MGGVYQNRECVKGILYLLPWDNFCLIMIRDVERLLFRWEVFLRNHVPYWWKDCSSNVGGLLRNHVPYFMSIHLSLMLFVSFSSGEYIDFMMMWANMN